MITATGAPPVGLLGPPVQVAYAVPDAVAAARSWAETFGAGPFFVRQHIQVRNVVHRGVASTFDHTSAYGQWGNIMVELVQDHSMGASPVRDVFADQQSGLHHLAFFVQDLDLASNALATLGMATVTTAETASGTRFCFVDAVAQLGHMLELYPPVPRLVQFYESVAQAAVGWDGVDPVRIAR